MLKLLIILAVLVVVAVLIYAATKSDTFRTERKATIKAPPEKLFPLINSLSQWPQWSPWEKLDPNMKRMPSGPDSGVGAVYAWEGNNKVGSGRMEITESIPSSKIVMKLDFFKPFEAHNTAEFTLETKSDSTEITWAIFGPQAYFFKVMGTLVDCDKMVGKDFEEGLGNLKGIAER